MKAIVQRSKPTDIMGKDSLLVDTWAKCENYRIPSFHCIIVLLACMLLLATGLGCHTTT